MRHVGYVLAACAVVLAYLGGACGDSSETGSQSSAASTGSGGTGGAGTGGSSAGGGGGLPCGTAGDCTPLAGPCATATCENGRCGVAFTPTGTPTAMQTAGDCKRVVCDGSGNAQPTPDDTDVPDDGNDCTLDACTNGMPTHTFASPNTMCMGGVCDDSGMCVACNAPSQCPGTDSDCAVRTCTAGMCGIANTPAGTPIALQTTGDCQSIVCDGAGATKSVADNTDAPDDLNVCTADSCNNGMPVHTPTPGALCGTNGICNASGQCTGCLVAGDCPGVDDFCKQRTCALGVCGFSFTADGTALPSASQTTGDCQEIECNGQGATKAVALDSDVPVDGLECTGDVCTAGTPSNPAKPAGTACTEGGGSVCDATGQCVACNVPNDCPSPGLCKVAACSGGVCAPTNSVAGTLCAPETCSGGVQQNQDTCDGGGTCVDGGTTSCTPYACGVSACATTCANDAGCAAGYTCDTGIARCSNGPKCTDTCNEIMTNCTGSYQQYAALENCLKSCATMPPGMLTDTSGNTVGCREYHGGAPAQSTPSVHCVHAGPGGAGGCGANCEGYCTIALGVCPGVYADMTTCMAACATIPDTVPYSTAVTSGNSLACRLYHLTEAAVDPTTHCAHIGVNSQACF